MVYFRSGKIFGIRSFEESDLNDLKSMLDDPEVSKFLEMGDRPTDERVLKNIHKEAMSQDSIVMSIVSKKDKKFIGTTGFYLINWSARRAQFRILIGLPKYFGKGIATEVTSILVEYAFQRLNLEMIYLGVNEKNISAINAYKNAGFKTDGKMRKFVYNNGIYYDSLHMSITKEDFLMLQNS